MNLFWQRLVLGMGCVVVVACQSAQATPGQTADPSCSTPDGAGALSTCLTPHQTSQYYVQQGNLYFDALDRSMPPENVPTYSELVARWEWPPWLSAATVNHPPRAEFGHRDGAGIRPRTRYHPLA